MVNYQNAKIYKLFSKNCDDPDMVYYGSTCQPLYKRKGGHKSKYKMWKGGKGNYMTSFKLIELGDVEIELVKKCPCNDKEELRKIEGEYIRNNRCINRYVAGRTPKDYYKDNMETIRKRKNESYKRNPDKKRIYYQQNKERILRKKKEYEEKNKERIKDRQRKYNEKNRERINARQREYQKRVRDELSKN